jgi:hypothetical protein
VEVWAYSTLAASGVALPAPKLLASGELYRSDDTRPWHWPYVVLSREVGIAFRKVSGFNANIVAARWHRFPCDDVL